MFSKQNFGNLVEREEIKKVKKCQKKRLKN